MKPSYLYDIDDHPPLSYAVVYGLQWAFIMFPSMIITATLCVAAFKPGALDEIRFLQLSLFTSGLFTMVQTLWGHRYPLLEGPSTALILAFILLAPLGLPAIQGAMAVGGVLLILSVLSRQLQRIIRLFTPNVIGVILMLIALGLLRPLGRFMTGTDDAHPQGEGSIFLISLGLVLFTATLAHRLRKFWKTLSILLGMMGGSLVFHLLGHLPWQKLGAADWISISPRWVESFPGYHWPAIVAFACAYFALMVNSLGSLQGIAEITDKARLAKSTQRGIFVTGVAGVVCGVLGVVGTVSFSMSPGVILANRVASRYAVTYCGAILLLSTFLPKLAALLALVPAPVVGAALCVGLGGQVGIGISAVASQKLTVRDYFVVGLPVLLGTLVGFLPSNLFDSLPGSMRVFVANNLITGIVLVLLLEHILLRNEPVSQRQ